MSVACFHRLSAREYKRDATHSLRELEQRISNSRRRWLQAHIERCNTRAAWHAQRRRVWAGREVEYAARQAAKLLRASRAHRDRARREQLCREYRAALRCAGELYATRAPKTETPRVLVERRRGIPQGPKDRGSSWRGESKCSTSHATNENAEPVKARRGKSVNVKL